MQYTLILEDKELNTIAGILQEWPYRIVRPILDNIAKQIDIQNQPKTIDIPAIIPDK
jgi:hypothetical protein